MGHVEEFYPHCGMGVRVWIWKDLIKEVRVQTGCEEQGGIQQGTHVGDRGAAQCPLSLFPVGRHDGQYCQWRLKTSEHMLIGSVGALCR